MLWNGPEASSNFRQSAASAGGGIVCPKVASNRPAASSKRWWAMASTRARAWSSSGISLGVVAVGGEVGAEVATEGAGRGGAGAVTSGFAVPHATRTSSAADVKLFGMKAPTWTTAYELGVGYPLVQATS